MKSMISKCSNRGIRFCRSLEPLGFPKYFINKNGHIFSRYKSEVKRIFGGISNGYQIVILKTITERKSLRVHRLLAQTFIPNPFNLPYINHKDGDRLNNRISNLEWCTSSHNAKHAYRTGLKKPKIEQMLKVTRKEVLQTLNGKVIKKFNSINEAARELDIYPSSISNNLVGRSKSSGGFVWKYAK